MLLYTIVKIVNTTHRTIGMSVKLCFSQGLYVQLLGINIF
jgi:hypothetical protein